MAQSPNLGALFGAVGAHTFLGLKTCGDLDKLDAPIAIVGAPCATPYASVGAYCRNAPAALRAAMASFAANIDRHDFDSGGRLFPVDALKAVDCGDLPYDEANPVGNRAIIETAVSKILAHGAVPFLIGGDDSVPIPMLQALGKFTKNLFILQIDAHIDWRDIHMGERLGLSSTMRRASELAHVGGILQVGARGIGSAATADYEDALSFGAQFVTAETIHRQGVQAALGLIPRGVELAICIDADALDPSIMPGVIGRSPGGLSYWQTVDLVRGAAALGRIAAMDFVEFMPERDVDGLGALTFARLIATSLGLVARQRSLGLVPKNDPSAGQD
jgi:agmatinase